MLPGMGTVAYLGTVVAICGLALGAIYVIVNLLGRRIDDLRSDMNTRFDGVRVDMDQRFDDAERLTSERFTAMDGRLSRLETQNDTIIDAVSDLGLRVTRLEARPGS